MPLNTHSAELTSQEEQETVPPGFILNCMNKKSRKGGKIGLLYCINIHNKLIKYFFLYIYNLKKTQKNKIKNKNFQKFKKIRKINVISPSKVRLPFNIKKII